MVPEGWREEKLGDLFEFKNGVNTEAANYGAGIKFVNVMDIFENDFLTYEKIRGMVALPDKKANIYKLKRGDVLFNRTSETFDEIALSTVYLDSKPAIFGGFVIRGRPVTNKLDSYFCIYCFSASRVRKELIRRGQGAIRANIGQADMRYVPLLVPSIPEQKKIAQILATWDKAIDIVEALIEKSTLQKKALMQQLLTGKKRLQSFSNVWQEVHLSEVAEIIVSNVDKKSFDNEVPVQLCNYTDVYYNDYITNEINFMKATAKNREIEKFSLQISDVIITKDSETPGDIAIPALVKEELDGVICGYHLVILRPKKNRAVGSFLCALFSLPRIRHYFFTLANGITRFGLSVGSIENAKFTIPDIEEQKIIGSLLEAEIDLINILHKKLELLKQEKKALMQQLLTGKRRVRLDEAGQAEARREGTA